MDYNPWFLDQVDSNNIKKMSVQANEIRGALREDKPIRTACPQQRDGAEVHHLFPVGPVDRSNHQRSSAAGDQQGHHPVGIETNPANSANGLVWLMLLLPTILFLGFIYLMMRRARDQFVLYISPRIRRPLPATTRSCTILVFLEIPCPR